MDATSLNPPCAKCGQPIPPTVKFCPHCGAPTQLASGSAIASALTSLGAGSTGQTQAPTVGTPKPQVGDAVTFDPSAAMTNLDSPSPKPTRLGDGPFQAGQQIGPRYTILKLLGVGGMGAVYQAFDHELGVAVAIKVIRPAAQSDATAAKDLEARFKRELVLARQVTHKYVVRIHDLGEIDGIKYLTMPFVEGDTLANVLRKTSTLPIDKTIKISQQIAQGLAAAHEQGVVHRDLKPENIMIEKINTEGPVPHGGDALIMDFGIARSMEAGATQTAAGSVIGTLEYMAPEQAQGKKVDQRCDQYSFGLIIYDMLVGRSRMANRENAMGELLERIAKAPPSPKSIDPKIPDPINDIVMKLLSPSPDDRFASTTDLVTALELLTPEGQMRTDLHEVVVIKSRPKWQLAAAAMIIVTMGVAGGWMFSRSLTPVVEAARDPITVLIGDFDNKTGDPLFDGVVEQALTLGVEGASFVMTFPRRDALRSATAIKPGSKLDEPTSRLVAQREGIGVVLTGSIEPKGSAYHIKVRGVSGGDGAEKLAVEDDASSKAEVLATVGKMAGQVRKGLGDTDVPAGGAGKETFTAANLEAASAYAAAQDLQALNKREDAIKKYEEALKFDADFGRAYSGLAAQYVALGKPVEAERNYQEALKRIDRMTDREKMRTRGVYYVFAKKNAEAVDVLNQLLKAYPFDSTGLQNLALANFYLRDFTQAMEQGRKAATLQPRNILRRYNVALYAMYAGQYDSAIKEADEALKLDATTLKALVAKGLSELALGKNADATKTYETLASTSPAGASFASAGLGDIAIVEGRLDDAIGILTKGSEADVAQKNAALAAAKRIAIGDVKLMRGDAAGAGKEAQAAVTAAPTDSTRIAAGLLLARAGRKAEAEALATEIENRLEPDPLAYAKLIRAELALSTKQPRAAFDLATEAAKRSNTWLGHLILGRALLELNQFPEAQAEFETALKRQGEATAYLLDDVPSFRMLPQVHYYLGRAQEGQQSAAAAQSYKTFLGFVKSSEAGSGLVADARARLAKIGS